jgi:hypothetical protein
MILFKIRGFRDLKLILKDANLGIEVEELEEIHDDATKNNLDFLKISRVEKDDNKLLDACQKVQTFQILELNWNFSK